MSQSPAATPIEEQKSPEVTLNPQPQMAEEKAELTLEQMGEEILRKLRESFGANFKLLGQDLAEPITSNESLDHVFENYSHYIPGTETNAALARLSNALNNFKIDDLSAKIKFQTLNLMLTSPNKDAAEFAKITKGYQELTDQVSKLPQAATIGMYMKKLLGHVMQFFYGGYQMLRHFSLHTEKNSVLTSANNQFAFVNANKELLASLKHVQKEVIPSPELPIAPPTTPSNKK